MNKFPVSTYRIRFSDCDMFAHLNNARFIDYFMNAREDHLREHYNFDLAAQYKAGTGWVVAGHEIFYVRPAMVGEVVQIQSALIDSGPEHILVEMQMFDEKRTQLKSLLWTRFVPVNLQTQRKEKHTEAMLQFVASVQADGFDVAGGSSRRLGQLIAEFKAIQPAR